MALKKLVKVSEVNNLSDARYCAGMGVEMIGFAMDENHPKFIELAKLREITQWITGIQVVGEFIGDNIENINYLSKELNLKFVQLEHLVSLEKIKLLKPEVILKLNFSSNPAELQKYLQLYKPYVSYFILESDEVINVLEYIDILKSLCIEYKIILSVGIEKNNIDIILNEINPAGLGLKGGQEIKPGLKNFEELAEILELLETDE